MKRIVCFIFVFSLVCPDMQAQKMLLVEKGRITFTSDAQLEMIRATCDDIQGRIDPVTNRFAIIARIQAFKGFNSALQQEHFNEKYMESEKYPNASFSGKIIEHIDFGRDSTYDVRAKGDLEIHGLRQTRIIKCHIVVKQGAVNVESNFIVPLSDHNISVPRIVTQKISPEIKVNIKAALGSK